MPGVSGEKIVEAFPNPPEPVKNLPFRLATTSFIYRDHIIPNVKRLGPFFDEIELLLFESKPFIPDNQTFNSAKKNFTPEGERVKNKDLKKKIIEPGPVDVLPTTEEIDELASLSRDLDVTYNIHLPVDISLTDRSRSKRLLAIDTVVRVVELCAPLNPTTHTLHLDCNIEPSDQEALRKWRKIACESLEILSSSLVDPSVISIETLHYPFEYICDLADRSGMDICVDAGHLILHGYSIDDIFQKYRHKIPLIHLHGVDFSSEPPKDHQSLDKTPQELFSSTLNVLKQFNGVVSLEVFNYEHMSSSLIFLNNIFMNTDSYFYV